MKNSLSLILVRVLVRVRGRVLRLRERRRPAAPARATALDDVRRVDLVPGEVLDDVAVHAVLVVAALGLLLRVVPYQATSGWS
eukprot:31074-Pelagococcus_subviridis.AAC.15